jgi:hypothetical protein
MTTLEALYVLIGITIYQAYTIYKLGKEVEGAYDLIVGLHTGDITLEKIEDEYDEY